MDQLGDTVYELQSLGRWAPFCFVELRIWLFSFYIIHCFFLNMIGEANFLGGVASVKGVKGFDPEAAKKRFFEIYLDKVFIFLLMLLLFLLFDIA